MLLLTVAFLSKGQDVKPIDPINFKALQSPSWSYMTLDSAIWVYKGSTYGWTKIHGDTHLKRYYVPYDNALRNVNLGDKKITSTKQRLPLFNGACVVPTITDNGNGSITVSNGEYHLSTNVDGRGTENFLINGGTFALTDQTQNYLVADYNSGTPILKVVTDVNLINETTVIPIYTAYRNGIFLHFQNWDSLGLALANKVHQSIVKTHRYRREYGLIVTEYGTHNLNMIAGRVWVGAVPVDIAEINTGVDNLSIWYHSGGNWVNSIQPNYNFTQWDNGTNLVTLTNNRYAVNWIFRGIENQKHLYIVLGRGDYSLVEAEASSMPPIPTAISSHAVLAARLIVEKNAATATNIKSAFDIQFSLASVQKHDDLTGRDVVNSHPASAISNTPAGNISSTNVQAAINELDTEKEPLLTKGLLTETVDGLELSSGGTRQVIGGAETITLTAGRVIPTTTNISHAETAYTHSQNDTDLSPTNEANTSLTYNQTTRVISVTDPVATRSATLPLATTTVDGLMSKTDKTKLDAVPSSIDSLFTLQFDSIKIEYGYLYNWYAATDVRNIANIGWHLSTYEEWQTLQTYLGGATIAGGKLKQTGFLYWNTPNTGATNETNFNARGTGRRDESSVFSGLTQTGYWYSYLSAYPSTAYHWTMYYSNDDVQGGGTINSKNGTAVRLVKDATSLTHGQTGVYVGNDGRIYRTICIGTQEWLADNLAETKYRNGDLIPVVTDNTAWAALTTGAMCSYNNIESNALAPISRDITINDTIYFDKTILGNSSQLEPLRVDTTIIATKHYVDSSTGGTQTLSTDGSAGNISISSGNTITLNVNDHTNRTALDNVSGVNTGDNATNTTSNSYADGKVQDAIVDGVITIAPSQNAVYDALANKVSKVTSTDNAIVRFDGTGGNIQNSGAYLFDSGNFYVGSSDENSYSRMLVYGGTNGANLDIRGEAGTFTDQATVEVMGNDYDTTTRSAYLQYKGSTHTGTTLGYSNANLSQLVMNGDNNLIYSSLAKPIIFGTNNQRSGMLDIDGKLVLDSLASGSPSIVTASTVGKLNKATFTTTGNSGAATFSLNNLNIPHYTLAGLGAGTAANNNTGDFILNQNSSAQTANGWITGTFDASGYKLSSTSLLLDWLKSGLAPASGNIVVGNGTTTSPSGVSVNQAIGGGLMQTNYMQYWDGNKFVNGNLFFVSSVYTQLRDNSLLYFVSRHSTNGGNILFNNGSGQNLILAETADNEYAFGNGGAGSLPVNRTLTFNTSTNAVRLASLSGTGTRLVSATSDGTLSNITNGTEGQVLKIVSGVPQFAASSGGLSVTPYLATSNSNYTLDLNTYINSRSSTNTNITITLSNLDDGETGNIEVTYTGAAVVTFVVDSSCTINMADNIWNTTTNAYTKSVTSMSSGTATYSYYRSGNNVKIHGTQYYQ